MEILISKFWQKIHLLCYNKNEMKQRNSKIYWLIFVGIVLIAAIIIFCIWLPYKNKTKAPDTDKETITNQNINQNLNENININNNTNASVNTNSASTQTNTNTASVNPDSSTSTSAPAATNYNAVQGGNFDER